MKKVITIGVMGERDGTFPPHRALDDAIEHSASELSLAAEPVWVATTDALQGGKRRTRS